MDLLSRLAGSLTPAIGALVAALGAVGSIAGVWAALGAPTRQHNAWSATLFSALFAWIAGLCAALLIVGLCAVARGAVTPPTTRLSPSGGVVPGLVLIVVTVVLVILAKAALPLEIPVPVRVLAASSAFLLGLVLMIGLRLASVVASRR